LVLLERSDARLARLDGIGWYQHGFKVPGDAQGLIGAGLCHQSSWMHCLRAVKGPSIPTFPRAEGWAKAGTRCIGCAHEATHAQWNEFTQNDVEAAVSITQELIGTLDG
jgi:hypothetical protein